jgi:hypothetical protein
MILDALQAFLLPLKHVLTSGWLNTSREQAEIEHYKIKLRVVCPMFQTDQKCLPPTIEPYAGNQKKRFFRYTDDRREISVLYHHQRCPPVHHRQRQQPTTNNDSSYPPQPIHGQIQ